MSNLETEYPTLSLRERDRRWSKVRDLMKAKELDCLLVAGLHGREQFDGYFTNDHVQGVVIFPLEGEPTCLTWTASHIIRHMENSSRGGTPWVEDIRVGPTSGDWVKALQEKGVESATIGVLGLETQGPGEYEGYIPYKSWFNVINLLPSATFVDVSKPFAELIIINSEKTKGSRLHS